MAEKIHSLTEDDLFRTSTQYRLWSYSPEALRELRKETNRLAILKLRRSLNKTQRSIEGQPEAHEDEEPEFLTPEEELKLVGRYCNVLMEFSDTLELPTNVKVSLRVPNCSYSITVALIRNVFDVQATAVQYLRRFYLSNSPMLHNPKQFMPTTLFLATKTDNHYISLNKFASKLYGSSPEAVKAPEFTLVQGLRFSFDVRHPNRGLEGGFMELQAMLQGRYEPRPLSPLSPQSIAEAILTVPSTDPSTPWEPSIVGVGKRLQAAHQKASYLLKTSALLSDAYFMYTPAQIWLSAFQAADQPLAEFYLRTIVSGLELSQQANDSKQDLYRSNPQWSNDDISQKLSPVLAALEGCKQLLISKDAAKMNEEERKELKPLLKKLTRCQAFFNTEASNKELSDDKKRDSEEGPGDEAGRTKKKRRVEDDNVFGGEIHK